MSNIIANFLISLVFTIVVFGICFMAITTVINMAGYGSLLNDNVGYVCVAAAILSHPALKMMDDISGNPK